MSVQVSICEEGRADRAAIRDLVAEAFTNHPHGSGREAELIDALRQAGALTLSLVAKRGEELLGHIAFTRVEIDGQDLRWFGLGPLAVRPARQRRGIGHALVEAGLARLRESRAQGCVVVGEPGFYGRFGFENVAGLRLDGLPPEFFLARCFEGTMPMGLVSYHRLFFAFE